jgi:hypothetical protein
MCDLNIFTVMRAISRTGVVFANPRNISADRVAAIAEKR